jgi:hypothetical protein
MSTPSQLKRLTNDWNTDWTRHTIRCVEILSGGQASHARPPYRSFLVFPGSVQTRYAK